MNKLSIFNFEHRLYVTEARHQASLTWIGTSPVSTIVAVIQNQTMVCRTPQMDRSAGGHM